MSKLKIGIQGGKGSFSEEAAQTFAVNHGIDDLRSFLFDG